MTTCKNCERLSREIEGRKRFASRLAAQIGLLRSLQHETSTRYGRLLERNVHLCRLLRRANVPEPAIETYEGEPPAEANSEFDADAAVWAVGSSDSSSGEALKGGSVE